MRLIGERRAGAAAVLAFFTLLFLGNALSPQLPPAFKPMFLGLGAVYLVSFFGVVAGWFWARWYTIGLGFSGVAMAILVWWRNGMDPLIVIFGATHAFIALALAGPAAAAFYDGRQDWRQRWRLDENGVNRLGKAFMRAGASLPYLVMAGLVPREGMGLVAGVAAVVLGACGLHALVRMRTWGVLALGGAAALTTAAFAMTTRLGGPLPGPIVVAAAVTGLLAAVIPFARPMFRTLMED